METEHGHAVCWPVRSVCIGNRTHICLLPQIFRNGTAEPFEICQAEPHQIGSGATVEQSECDGATLEGVGQEIKSARGPHPISLFAQGILIHRNPFAVQEKAQGSAGHVIGKTAREQGYGENGPQEHRRLLFIDRHSPTADLDPVRIAPMASLA